MKNNVALAYALKISDGANVCQEGVFLADDRPPETFGQRLKRLAKARGYTNRALARETGAHETTVARWMMGTVPEGRYLVVLIGLLGKPLDYLLEPVGQAEAPKGTTYPRPDLHPVARKPVKRRRKGREP